MKSLRSIINGFSHHEIGDFRLFLSGHCRNGKNKKLELFDKLVDRKGQSADSLNVSRQSVYQLKKRLKEDLYAFLVTQDQVRDSKSKLFLEMECHKKLYCFKILFDKGIYDHAHEVLADVISISSKNALHSLYLEAVDIKNIYFPLTPSKAVRKIPFDQEIGKLKKSLGRNFYINRYLSESGNCFHENEDSFRRSLMDQLGGFDLGKDEPVIDVLLGVNNLFYQKKFCMVHDKVAQVVEGDTGISTDSNMLSLVYVELIKACLSMHAFSDAGRWLDRAPESVFMAGPFADVLLELKMFIAIKSGDTTRLKEVRAQSKALPGISGNSILTARWSYYFLLMDFLEGDFKRVIKAANGDPILLFKDRSWLMNVKMLELMSICALNDWDWLFYKIESFRKVFSGAEWKQQRISQVVNVLRARAGGKELSGSGLREKLLRIEADFPWHPLSNEVFNYCTYVGAMLGAASPAVWQQTVRAGASRIIACQINARIPV